MDGVWSVLDVNTYIDCQNLYNYAKAKKYKVHKLSIECIAYKPLDGITLDNPRYISANISLPAIVCEGMKNPLNKRYRLLDGRHRLLKSINNQECYIKTYILQQTDCFKFIKDLQ